MLEIALSCYVKPPYYSHIVNRYELFTAGRITDIIHT